MIARWHWKDDERDKRYSPARCCFPGVFNNARKFFGYWAYHIGNAGHAPVGIRRLKFHIVAEPTKIERQIASIAIGSRIKGWRFYYNIRCAIEFAVSCERKL